MTDIDNTKYKLIKLIQHTIHNPTYNNQPTQDKCDKFMNYLKQHEGIRSKIQENATQLDPNFKNSIDEFYAALFEC
jgi:hypothetical protein